MRLTEYAAFSRVETLGSPVFPCFPFLPLICSPTPTRPPQLAQIAVLVLSQLIIQLRLRYSYNFRGSIAYLQQSLSTLRANISVDYARLASGGWLTLPDRIGYLQGN